MTAHKLIAKIARMTPPGDDADDNALTLARIIDEARSIVAALPQDEIAGLIKLLKITPLYEGSGEESDLPETAADAIEALVRERDEATARVGELDAALAEIGSGYYADRDSPWRLDRVVNIARAVRNRLPWEPIAELKVTDEEKARGEGLAQRAEKAERELAEARAALTSIRELGGAMRKAQRAVKINTGSTRYAEQLSTEAAFDAALLNGGRDE